MGKKNKSIKATNASASAENRKISFQEQVKLAFAERNVPGPHREDVNATFAAADELVRIVEKELPAKKKGALPRKDYPVLGHNPFIKNKKREDGDRKYNEKYVARALKDYELFKYAEADTRIDRALAKILKKKLNELAMPLSKVFAQKVEGGPTLAGAIRNKNNAKYDNLVRLSENLDESINSAGKLEHHFRVRTDDVISILAKMGVSPSVSSDLKQSFRDKTPGINAEVSAYEKEGLDQVALFNRDQSLADPEVIFEHFLSMWENMMDRMHQALKNKIDFAALSAAFVDVYGDELDFNELLNKKEMMKDQIQSMQNQMNFVRLVQKDYESICLRETPLLATGTYHAPAVAGENYSVDTQAPAAPQAVA